MIRNGERGRELALTPPKSLSTKSPQRFKRSQTGGVREKEEEKDKEKWEERKTRR